MFKILGILVLFYTLYGANKGEIYAKSGVWGKTIRQSESPHYFWSVIAIYTGLGLALIFLF